MAGFNAKARYKARCFALQALYQWRLTGNDLFTIEADFKTSDNFKKVDEDYFHELLHKVTAHVDRIDEQFTEFLDREFESLNPIELTVLRLGTYELLYRPDIPPRVIINEAVELTKRYRAEQGYRYINAVLDKVAKATRKTEFEG